MTPDQGGAEDRSIATRVQLPRTCTLRSVFLKRGTPLLLLALAAFSALFTAIAVAGPESAPQRLRIAVAEFPPYAVKGEDGVWHGRSVDLFVAAAADVGAAVEFVEAPISQVLRRIDSGELDGSALPFAESNGTLGVVTLTSDWDTVDLKIAASGRDPFHAEFVKLIESLFGHRQLKMYLWLGFSLVTFAVMIWLVERRRNPPFAGRSGVGEGLWWSVTTLSTVGYGDSVPRTPLGRLTAGAWMIVSLILVALFTATVTNALQANDSTVQIRGAHDLPMARAGIVDNGPAAAFFSDHFLPHISYPTIDLAIRQLGAGELDAVVAEAEVLTSAIAAHNLSGPANREIRMLPETIDRRGVAFGLRRSLPPEFLKSFDAALVRRTAGTRAVGQP